uniref:F-box/kelch-repeat protein At3g06240-like isoform X2 n=1 Tax=Fragaria vesca subsp. vesca TaxID=101020 RepID=UPI0005CB63A6|nr:PREDICTED: F-box/kelch-repeat protein At3g06240-like isoform X2 [Fragaria vesca subsp. vesca]
MSMSKKKEQSYDLPEDVIVKILCRLPVKSLIRFSCVSKRWRSIIISDPQFGKSHLEVASQQGTLCRKVLISIYPTIKPVKGYIPDPLEDGLPWLPSRFQSLEGYSSVSYLTLTSEEKSQRVMASCNGLVLLGESYQGYFKNLSIWNPSTGFFRKLPTPCFARLELTKSTEDKWCINFLYYGFGQVSNTDDYKVVFIKPAPGDFVNVHVFSLGTNSWKVIKAPSSSWAGCNDRQGALSNGAIHWVNYSNPIDLSHPTLVAFDLAAEEFRQVPLPVFNRNEDDMREIRLQVLLGGGLCVRSVDLYEQNEFWVMREYDEPKSWVKLIEFDGYELPDEFASCKSWDPIFVSEAGTVLIKLLDKMELVWIECLLAARLILHLQEEKPVCSARYRIEEYPGAIFDAIVYDETLVSVPE